MTEVKSGMVVNNEFSGLCVWGGGFCVITGLSDGTKFLHGRLTYTV